MRPGRSAAAAATLAVGLAVAVWVGVLEAGGVTPRGTQPPLLQAIETPMDCQACHGDFDSSSDHEPWSTWAGSMMANSSRDPLFWAALDVANNDVPGVGEYCIRCHVPKGWLEGRSSPPDGSADGCLLVGALDEDFDDFSGVSCHLCHRLEINDSPPPGEDPFYLQNAELWVDDEDCPGGSEPCRRGPYDYSGGGVPPPHVWAFSDYHLQGDFCGACHNVTSPTETLIDESGVDTGLPYPIERTHREWEASDYPGAGIRCQDCHMEDTPTTPVFACHFMENDRSGDLATHGFAGGNNWIPRVLRDEYPNLMRTEAFNATIARAEATLASAAAVEVFLPEELPEGGVGTATVRVTNLSGHKLPTGYSEGRRMWIHVEARDAIGAVFWESGVYDDVAATILEDPQLKVYRRDSGIWDPTGSECEIEDESGNEMFHFVLNNCILLDNRIPPQGFTGGADVELRPVGYSYPETSPGSGILVHWDDTDYDIPVPEGVVGPITVEATLRYQVTTREYVEFLDAQAELHEFPDDCLTRTGGPIDMSRGEYALALWNLYDRAPPVEMTSGSENAPLLPAAIFSDGFESGDTGAWSLTVPAP